MPKLTTVFIVMSSYSYGECTKIEGVRFDRRAADMLVDDIESNHHRGDSPFKNVWVETHEAE
jgi:hypothetical protein